MFKVDNEASFLRLLKIISEEAVKKSKKELRENEDPYIANYKKKLDNDKLLEQEEEEDEEADEEAEAKPKDKPEDEVDAEEKDEMPATKKAREQESEIFGSSFDSVITAINTLRAGRSLKDKTTKTELNDYYDRLDENERAVLLLFLKELSKILTGAIEGEEAQDPSDPRAYFDITRRSEEKKSDEKAAGKNLDRKIDKPDLQKVDKQVSDSGEDTTPPIRVNESQDVTHLREKVRQLMRS
jgi:mRNA-degrading endonuclease RelE of RelBE toxin-antitoxin system